MPSWQSIRFRLSVQYSALVFGLGGAILGLVYLAIRTGLRNETMTRYVVGGKAVEVDGGVVIIPQLLEQEYLAIETVYNEIVLTEMARFTVFALIGLFLLSLVIGWIMSGRVLKPVGEITSVARDIQASDLSRRIALDGPDDELKRLADTFDGMLDRLDRAFSSQRQFLADTSHDLRTPLAVIQSNVELVAEDPEASLEEWRETGGVVRRNTEKMAQMIDALLAAARLQAGKAQSVSIDLADLVTAKATEFAPVASEKNLVVNAAADHVMVQGVDVTLDRALSNLVDNANKAAPLDSAIRLSSGLHDGWAFMSVEDEGPGLPQDMIDQVGLGLSIVTQIAEAHGGALANFDRAGGPGTMMVVWLPTDSSSETPPQTGPEPGRSQPAR